MEEKISFAKMSGAGNDFIVMDNRHGAVETRDLSGFAAKVCARRLSVGADGLILIEKSRDADFRWQFFNSDGSRGEMCGNGARCAARFAWQEGIAPSSMTFETDAGLIRAEVDGDRVKIQMTNPSAVKLGHRLNIEGKELEYGFVNTGVPHAVLEVENLAEVDVVNLGRLIRNHDVFQPAGTNVNFIACDSNGIWEIRTYERGVENETLACGTGSVAAALALATKGKQESPVRLKTASGVTLSVYFKSRGKGCFDHVFLEGDARVIYKAVMHPDAWDY